MRPEDGQSRSWWQCEPRRLQRDRVEVTEFFPDLVWEAEDAGRWRGRLPLWPFERPEPAGLRDLIGHEGMPVVIEYGHAYPMIPPGVFPVEPQPDPLERTQNRFHVMGDGSLCLLQDDVTWTGRSSITDLLLKAAGWRVEYALIKVGAIEAMSLYGIVDDAQFDHLVARAASAVQTRPLTGTAE